MRWWLRTKCRLGGLAFLVAGLLTTVVYASADFPAPRLGGVAAVPTALIAPSLIATSAVLFRDSAAPINEYRAVRRMALLETALTCALLALVCAVLTGSGVTYGGHDLLAANRNFLAYAGLALGFRQISAGAAATSAIAYAIVLAVLGSPAAWWSFPLKDGADPTSWAAAGILLLIGLSLSAARATALKSDSAWSS